MLRGVSHTRLLRYAGLFTWAMVAAPLIYSAVFLWGQNPDAPQPIAAWAVWLSYGMFGALYWWLTRRMGARRPGRPLDYLLVLLLLCCAVGVSYLSGGTGLGSVLGMVAACVLPWILPVGLGFALLLASQLAIAPVYVFGQNFDWTSAILQSLLYAGFCTFIFVTSLVARQQADSRDEQRRLNAELRATRALLAESARVNERTRIARELHDLLGHHLTALSLNLEVAGHLTAGKAQEHVRQGHTLAKLLLTDVREAVSQMREDAAALHVAAALRPLAENVPNLEVVLDVPDDLVVEDAGRAHALLRAVQEIITNAVRHSGAERLDLRVWRDGLRLMAEARDNGRGADTVHVGNGLRGLSERLKPYGGQVSVQSAAGQGFALTLVLPLGDNEAASPQILEQGVNA